MVPVVHAVSTCSKGTKVPSPREHHSETMEYGRILLPLVGFQTIMALISGLWMLNQNATTQDDEYCNCCCSGVDDAGGLIKDAASMESSLVKNNSNNNNVFDPSANIPAKPVLVPEADSDGFMGALKLEQSEDGTAFKYLTMYKLESGYLIYSATFKDEEGVKDYVELAEQVFERRNPGIKKDDSKRTALLAGFDRNASFKKEFNDYVISYSTISFNDKPMSPALEKSLDELVGVVRDNKSLAENVLRFLGPKVKKKPSILIEKKQA